MKRIGWFPVLIAALIAACPAPKNVKKGPEATPVGAGEAGEAGKAAGQESKATPQTEVAEASVRGSEFTQSTDIATIHFDYDSYALGEEARATLKKNADYLKAHADLDVLAAGNCDERGTIAYNLALGQKRAKAVRDFYIRLGVSGKRVATISYGKEKPVCSESNESCWTKNRRGDTLVRAQAAKSTTR